MRERCLQSLAILLAGLFSAERARERAQAERNSASGMSADERAAALPKPKAERLKN
jgi:hypothetical protein